MRSLKAIIRRAKNEGRVSQEGLVLCDNCDTPASRSLSRKLSWTCCAPCVWGEADNFDPKDTIDAKAGPKGRGFE